MKSVSLEEYQQLLGTCRLVQEDAYGPKVLQSEDGIIIKIFRRRNFFSRSLFSPPARRFTTNAQRLISKGLPTVTVLRYGRCHALRRDLVWYRYLEGETLRDLCGQNHDRVETLVEQLGGFVALLHQQGVLFRSLHWNNVLVQPDGSFALIDVLDIQFKRHPLTISERRRNFSHLLCRHKQDRDIYLHNTEAFWRGYTRIDELTSGQLKSLQQLDLSMRK